MLFRFPYQSLTQLHQNHTMGSENIKEKIEVINISDEKKNGLDTSSSSDDKSSIYSSDGREITSEGYIHDLQWTPEEERAIVNKIDIRLMSFVLLMTFVLNMDRTNICKSVILHIKNIPSD